MAEYRKFRDGRVTIYSLFPVTLKSKECTYCGGPISCKMWQERERVKRQPPPGAADLNIFDEFVVLKESWFCGGCHAGSPEVISKNRYGSLGTDYYHNSSGIMLRRCAGAENGAVDQDHALSLPEFPVSLTSGKSSDGEGNSHSHSCTNCLKCYVCGNLLQSRDLVYAIDSSTGIGIYDTSESYRYAHKQCGPSLLPKLYAHYEQEEKKLMPRKKKWWQL